MATASISVATGGAHSGNQILTFTISGLSSQLQNYAGFYVTTTTVPASNASTTAQISTLESNLICQWLKGDYAAEGWPTSTATSINYLKIDSPSRTKVKDLTPYQDSSVTVRVFAKTSGSTYYFVSNASYTPGYAWAGNDLLKTAVSYTTSGTFRSGSTYLSYPVGYTAESPHTYTTAVHASGSGNTAYAEYSFDFSQIPSSATINSVEVRCRGQRYSTTDTGNYKADLELYTGSTLKVSSKFTSTSAQTITIAGGTWTRAQLQDARLRFTVGYYGGRLYGITWSVKYTSNDGIVRELKDTSVTLNAITRDWNGDSWYSMIGASTDSSINYLPAILPLDNWKGASYLSGQDITVTGLLPNTNYYVWMVGRDSNYYRLYNRYLAGTSTPTSGYFYQFTTLRTATATTITGQWNTHTGSNQALVTKSGGTGRTVYYRLGTSGSFSTSIPQASAVGSYTVQWYSTFNSGYSGTDEGSESSPRSVTAYIYKPPTGLSLPYTGSEQKIFTDPELTVAGLVWQYREYGAQPTESWTNWSSTSSDLKRTNAGSTKFSWRIGPAGLNPSDEGYANGTVEGTITKVDPTYTSPTPKDLTYSGSAQQLVTAGTATGGTMWYRVMGDGDVGWTSNVSNVVGTAIGDNYQVYYYVKGDSNHNDIGSTSQPIGFVTSTISQAVPTYTAPTGKTLTYSGSDQQLITAGTVSGGTLYYRLGTSGTWTNSASSITSTNADTYTIYYYIKGDSTHSDIGSTSSPAGSVTTTIGKASAYTWTTTPQSKVFASGTSQALVTAGTATGGTKYYKLSTASSYSTSIPTASTVGAYTINYYIKGDSNHEDGEVGSVISYIYTAPTAKTNLSYTGSSQTLFNNGSAPSGYTVQYRLASASSSTSWTTTVPSQTNAGTYEYHWRIASGTGYSVTPIVGGATDAYKLSVTIAKLDPTYTPPTGKTVDYSPGMLSQRIADEGTATNGTLYYRLGTSGSWTTSINSMTGGNAGSYDVYYYVKGNTNYNDIGSTSSPIGYVTGVINPIDPGYFDGVSVNYDGRSHELVDPEDINGTPRTIYYRVGTSGSFSTTVPTATGCGSYTIYYYVVSGNSNYTDAGSASNPRSVTSTINQIPAVISQAPSGKTLTYTGSAQQLINAGTTTTVLWYRVGTSGSWTSIASQVSATDVGTYTIYYYAAADQNHTSAGSESDPYGSVTATIGKADPTYTAPAARTLSYTGSAQQLVDPGVTSHGTFYYRVGTSGTWTNSVSSVTGTNALDYNVYYYIVGDSNHNDAGSASSPLGPVAVTIQKAEPTYTAPVGKTVSYTGASQQIANAGTATHGTLYYRLGTSGSWVTAISSMVGTNAGDYNVYYYVKGDTNYSDIGSTSSPIGYVTGTIEKLSAGSVAGVTLDYTGSAQTIVNPSVVNGTARYRVGTSGSFSTTQPTRTDVGTYTVQYYITPSDTTNYSAVGSSTSPISITSEIVAIPATYTAPTARDLTYTGIAQILVNAGTVSGGAMYYRVGTSGSWTSSLTTITGAAAGDYQVYYYIAPDSNHTHTSSATNPLGPVTVTIDKADPTYSAPTGKTVTYNGSSQQIANAGSATNGTMYYRLGTSGSWTTSISSMVGTNAGSYSVYYYIKGNTNYNDIGSTSSPLGPVTGTIEKKSAGSVEGVTVDYTGSAQAMAVPSVANGTARYRVGTSGSFSTTVPTRTNVGTYTIQYYITPSDSTNYSAVGTSSSPISITSSIEAVAPTYTSPSGRTVTYSGSSQQIANSGSVTGGTMYYRLGTSGSWVTTISSMAGTNVGDYNVYYYVAGDSNHTDIGSTTSPIGYVTGTVEKADASYTAPSGLTKHYTGVAQQIVTAGSASGGTMYYRVVDGSGSQIVNWTSTLSSVAATNIDTGYKIYYYVLGDSNHNNMGSTSNPIGYVSSKIVSSVGVYTGSSWSRYSGGYYSTTSTYNGDCLVYYFDGTEWKLCGYK